MIVQGRALVKIDDDYRIYEVGESVYIPRFAPHRVKCESDEDLVFIETQTGEYFGEDDIVRIQDDYDRR